MIIEVAANIKNSEYIAAVWVGSLQLSCKIIIALVLLVLF